MEQPIPDERSARGFKRIWIDYTLQVDAPPGDVASLLSDIDAWPEWSPGLRAIRRRKGPLAPGARFTMALDIPPLPFPLVLPCELFVLEPGRIEWGGGVPGSVIRHRFELTPTGSGQQTEVRHVEYATNLLALLSLPAERFARAHDKRWSHALRDRFTAA